MKNIVVITGCSGVGKSTYCRNTCKPYLEFDSIFNYKNMKLSTKEIDDFFKKYSNEEIIYLDAFRPELIKYIRDTQKINDIQIYLLYTNLDDNMEALSIDRDFANTDCSYDSYIEKIIETINYNEHNMEQLYISKQINGINYIYRNKGEYKIMNNNHHMHKLINESKKDRLINYVKEHSGHATYQSIILNNECVIKGTEGDWITFDNIKKCTSLKNKIVCDTGCFNGYFSFKCIEEGAKKIIGIDCNAGAIDICNKLCLYNGYHHVKFNKITDTSCEKGIQFYLQKIGVDNIFDDVKINPSIDIIFVLNYLHHLVNELGLEKMISVVDSFYKNSKEVIYEINEKEFEHVDKVAKENNFILKNNIESHRKTIFGNRLILHYVKN